MTAVDDRAAGSQSPAPAAHVGAGPVGRAPAAPVGEAPAADAPGVAGTRPAGVRWRRWAATAVVAALAVGAGGYGVAAMTGDDAVAAALGPGDVTVQLDVEHSLFAPEELRVVEGTRVRFVVVNGDPIDHELIVGPPDLHARHADGTEAEHPSVPGEVSVGPNGAAITTLRFDEAGTFEFACHLPGHYEHGMHGVVEVVPGVR